MKSSKIIRYSVLAWGIVLAIYVGFINLQGDINAPDVYIIELLGLFTLGILWNTWPHVAYFFLARKAESIIISLIPGLTICTIQLLGVISYDMSKGSTAGLAFFFISIIEAVCAISAFFLSIFIIAGIDIIKNKDSKEYTL